MEQTLHPDLTTPASPPNTVSESVTESSLADARPGFRYDFFEKVSGRIPATRDARSLHVTVKSIRV